MAGGKIHERDNHAGDEGPPTEQGRGFRPCPGRGDQPASGSVRTHYPSDGRRVFGANRVLAWSVLLYVFSIDLVDEQSRVSALRAIPDSFQDELANGEVLDLFEAALGAADNGENLARGKVGSPISPPPSQCGERNEAEGKDGHGQVREGRFEMSSASVELGNS